ncbi:hypothetical protein [Streptomyces sp. NPDC051546]|uniref:hypothetical protein n=1 Tax=Streptomyces sp. NPDC051546 TaxID=3365655 RepID=UPI0037A4AB31
MPTNRHRAAELCTRATGVPHRVALGWASQGLITRECAIPDAEDPEQRSFEARVALVLGNALRDSQSDAALLGFTGAWPTGSGLVLHVHPDMDHRVIHELTPRFDAGLGRIRGVPGLRLDWQSDSGIILRCVAGGSAIRLSRSQPAWQCALPCDGDGLTYVGRYRQEPLHPTERQELDDWYAGSLAGHDPTARDWLLSRLLRRPLLVNSAGTAHGSANTYSHGYEDLVIEWCCGPDADVVEAQLRRSGLAAPPPRSGYGVDVERLPGVINLGEARVIVRSHGTNRHHRTRIASPDGAARTNRQECW